MVRVAGNILDDLAVLASLEYAVAHLKTPLLMVLGHQHCGAVKAAVAALAANDHVEGHLGFVVDAIGPAIDEARAAGGDLVEQAVRRNVERVVDQLRGMEPILAGKVRDRTLKVVGAYYALESGQVEILGGAG